LRNEVSRLAHGANDIVDVAVAAFADGQHVVPRLVKCGSHEIVHGGIDDCKIALFAPFQILDPGKKDAGVAGEEPSRLE
jgi:hypothetical protein